MNLDGFKWTTPVDLNPRYNGNDLLTHYGETCVTSGNVVITSVKQNLTDGFTIRAFRGLTGAAAWTESTDYSVPSQGWIPSCSPTLVYTRGTRADPMVAYPMGGGRIAFRATASTTASPVVYAFYGNSVYNNNPSAFQSNVKICTPLTAGPDGSIYFGFIVYGANPANLTSGLAKVTPAGVGSWVSAATLSNDSAVNQIKQNCAPAIDSRGSALYVTTYAGSFSRGTLVKLSPVTLQPQARVRLLDPRNGNDAAIDGEGTASPLIGPDGDVYQGVLENPFGSNHLRGILLHYSGDLQQTKIPGAFGWDDTPTVVPSYIVNGYTGHSSYLLMCKYNNYVAGGGDGANKVAIVDPNDLETDVVANMPTMKVVISQLGPTPDQEFLSDHPNAVREWCVNSAAVDVPRASILVSSEDGVLYRWDLHTNTLSQSIRLTDGIGEAYTPTAIGPDGRVYAIANATLYAVGLAR
ncbi:MAG: hypothetical protein GC165_18000 [Armatimonadetes bacterium]|nr:hypothetical protein [Armatimonadota bacterium]MBS1726595.1 hypothetical protein [Armatimonadota bacterium]